MAVDVVSPIPRVNKRRGASDFDLETALATVLVVASISYVYKLTNKILWILDNRNLMRTAPSVRTNTAVGDDFFRDPKTADNAERISVPP